MENEDSNTVAITAVVTTVSVLTLGWGWTIAGAGALYLLALGDCNSQDNND